MSLLRRRWNCGEADWLTDVAGEEPKRLLGYPMHFTAREVVDLDRAGITAALAANIDHELDFHVGDIADVAEWGPLGYQT